MKSILLIQTGSTLPELIPSKGDFKDWIMQGTGLPQNAFRQVNVETGEALPDFDAVAGILITGSHAMVTDHLPWSEKTARWLAGAVAGGIPTLGICYGHQLLAYALGGNVIFNPNGREYGTHNLTMTAQAQSDPLFEILPQQPDVHLSHLQTVSRLPEGAVRLAFSQKDSHQAFSYHQIAWGTQFHPEYDAEVTRAYIRSSYSELAKQGEDPEALLVGCHETPYGHQILHRFTEIVRTANK